MTHRAILLLTVACAGSASPDSDLPRLTLSFDPPKLVLGTHDLTGELARHRLVQDPGDSPPMVSAAAGPMLSSETGRVMFSLLVACALPEEVTLVAVTPFGELDFFGEIGLAPKWFHSPLDQEGRRWVSACIISRLNPLSVALPISDRGPNPALRTSRGERAGWPLQEGAFYGDLFTAPDRPIEWTVCRGTASPASPSLVDRRCSKPDPANPGLTQCGFVFAGDCSDVCKSGHGFYRDCQASGNGDAFREVITTYVTP